MKDKRIVRLVKLLQMLQGGRGQKWDGLAKTFGVGRRTIFRDLETLRLAGVPIEFEAQAQRYSIPSGNFGPPSDLTAEEAFSIWALANSVGRHPHIPFYESLRTAIRKFERKLPVPARRKLRRMSQCVSFLPMKLSNLAAKSSVYQCVVEAIEKRRAFRMEYHSLFEWELIATKVRPFRLVFCDHSWYIMGHSSMHGEVRTFNLVRIKSLKLLSERFSIPKSFDLDRRIGNAWTMIPEAGDDSRIVVKFASMVARNVAEVTWHKTQRTKFMPDGSLIFQATVSGLNEISWWILQYGDQAEVVHPLKLKRIVAQRIKKMAANYKLHFWMSELG